MKTTEDSLSLLPPLSQTGLVSILFAIGFIVAFFVSGSNSVLAADRKDAETYPRFELEEVVVTGAPAEEPIRMIPRNVTVITSRDIAQAPSNNVVDLLAREANVNLQSFFGHDKQAGLDIRGMGESNVSNVIVMVDGFRLNSPDVLGPDLTSVPLDQIERIEILRGAASVVYGDGAVGGVVNIITKRAEKKPEVRLYSSYGSYDTFDERGSCYGQAGKVQFNMSGSYYDSEGYRENAFLEKKDVAARFGYDLSEHVSASVSAAYHDDEYGLPGSVSIDDIDSRSRRDDTDFPDDFGETTDRRVMGDIETDLGNWGVVRVNGVYRLRDNDFVLAFNPLEDKGKQMSEIDEDTKSLDVNYVREYEVGGLSHNFEGGIDYYQTDYISQRPGERTRKNSDVYSLGVFFTNHTALQEDLMLRLGYRYNTYDGTYRTDDLNDIGSGQVWINGDEFGETWRNDAYELGLVFTPTADTTFFASFATSFRIPNVDELAQAVQGLGPQEGKHIEMGARHRTRGFSELTLTLFHIRIEDEIFFDGDGRLNRNFEEETERQGVEMDVKFYPAETLYLWGNYTYMTARFHGSDQFIPLVPRYKVSAGAEWRILDPFLLAVTGTWVGSRHDGNDKGDADFEKVDSYKVFDVKITYTFENLRIFAGVNNVFDELYSTLAFTERYFPMPTRNYYGGVAWVF